MAAERLLLEIAPEDSRGTPMQPQTGLCDLAPTLPQINMEAHKGPCIEDSSLISALSTSRLTWRSVCFLRLVILVFGEVAPCL